MLTTAPAINQQIRHKILDDFGVELFIKREDLVFPSISGNKFRKLKYNLIEARNQGFDTLLTFGGAYSNHIHATAAAGKQFGFKTIGIIRGEELGERFPQILEENHTLQSAHKNEMQFHFVSREAYRTKETSEFIKHLQSKFGEFYVIPEGGTNPLAIKGCEEILNTDDKTFDYICTAVGTGGTVAGLANAALPNQKVLGFSMLKETYLDKEIKGFTTATNWELVRNYHFGKYAKVTPELIDFINQFYKQQQIPLDPIYTGKLLYGIFQEIKADRFSKNSRILAIHTGGLQGIYGVNAQLSKRKASLINFANESH